MTPSGIRHAVRLKVSGCTWRNLEHSFISKVNVCTRAWMRSFDLKRTRVDCGLEFRVRSCGCQHVDRHSWLRYWILHSTVVQPHSDAILQSNNSQNKSSFGKHTVPVAGAYRGVDGQVDAVAGESRAEKVFLANWVAYRFFPGHCGSYQEPSWSR